MIEHLFSQDGLVVVSAKYGAAEAIRLAEQLERNGQQNGPPHAEASTSQAAGEPSPPHSRRFTPRSPGVQWLRAARAKTVLARCHVPGWLARPSVPCIE